jgi:hypothetical protein
LDRIEKLGKIEAIFDDPVEVTREQLRKPDPHSRDELFKAGVMSLKQYVERNQRRRAERTEREKTKKGELYLHYSKLIEELGHQLGSSRAAELLDELALGGGLFADSSKHGLSGKPASWG